MLLICNSYIPPWEVVVLHIGVEHSQTAMCKTTPHYRREIWATFLDVA